MPKTRVNVKIAGQTIPLSGDHDEEYILSVAEHVQNRVSAIEQVQPAISTTHSLIMAALHITEELFTLRKQYEELDCRIEELRALSAPYTAKTPEKHPFDKSKMR